MHVLIQMEDMFNMVPTYFQMFTSLILFKLYAELKSKRVHSHCDSLFIWSDFLTS